MPEELKILDMEVRLPILRAALLAESFISIFLAKLLGIGDYRASKSFSARKGEQPSILERKTITERIITKMKTFVETFINSIGE